MKYFIFFLLPLLLASCNASKDILPQNNDSGTMISSGSTESNATSKETEDSGSTDTSDTGGSDVPTIQMGPNGSIKVGSGSESVETDGNGGIKAGSNGTSISTDGSGNIQTQ